MLEYKDKHSENFQKALDCLDKDDREELRKILDEDKTLLSEYSISKELRSYSSESGKNSSNDETVSQRNLVWFAIKKKKIECLKLLIANGVNLEEVEKISYSGKSVEESDFGFRDSSSSNAENKNFMDIAKESELSDELKQILFDCICDKKMVDKYKNFILENLVTLNIDEFKGRSFNFLNCSMNNSKRRELKAALQGKGYNLDNWRITNEEYYEDIINKDFIPSQEELGSILKTLENDQKRQMYNKFSGMPQKPKDLIDILLSDSSLKDEKKRIAQEEMTERNKKLFEQDKKKMEDEKERKDEKKRKSMDNTDSKNEPRKKQRVDDKKEKETVKKVIINDDTVSSLKNNQGQTFFRPGANSSSDKHDSEQSKKDSFPANNF